MAQTSILGRIGQLVRANVNAILDSAEDPEKMLDQLVRDFTNNIAEAEDAVAQTIGNLRLVEDDAQGGANGRPRLGRRRRPRHRAVPRAPRRGKHRKRIASTSLAKIALRRQLSSKGQATDARDPGRRSRPSSPTSSRTG